MFYIQRSGTKEHIKHSSERLKIYHQVMKCQVFMKLQSPVGEKVERQDRKSSEPMGKTT